MTKLLKVYCLSRTSISFSQRYYAVHSVAKWRMRNVPDYHRVATDRVVRMRDYHPVATARPGASACARDWLPYRFECCLVVGWSLRLWAQPKSYFIYFIYFFVCCCCCCLWTDVHRQHWKTLPLNTRLLFSPSSPLFQLNKCLSHFISLNACSLELCGDESLQFDEMCFVFAAFMVNAAPE